MAHFSVFHFVLFSLLSQGLTISIKDLFGLGYLRQPKPEPQVVEVIRWRQPVCITASPEIPLCSSTVSHVQPTPPVHAHGSYPESHQYDIKKEELVKKLNEDNNSARDISSSFESNEESDDLLFDRRRSARSAVPAASPSLFSPRIVRSIQLENLGLSSLGDPLATIPRRKRYLRLGSGAARNAPKGDIVYVTKVVDSPIIATLVATHCIPDIGVPLCKDVEAIHPAHGGAYQTSQLNPAFDTAGYPLSVGTAGYYHHQHYSPTTASPNIIENVQDFINRPDYVQTGESPDVKPVVVVQPTSPPGIFDGINAFLMPNGTWFFNQPIRPPQLPQLPQLPQFPQLPPLPQFPQFPQFPLPSLPQIPSWQEMIWRPENDISDNHNVYVNNEPGYGPATESPGIFGGLFPAPTRPEAGHSWTTTTTTTQAPSLLDNIFRPTRRPLVIENPDQRPVVVEKPVYVVEQPVIPNILDLFQDHNRPIKVNSSEAPEVIKDPVYVLQKPAPNQIFGIGVPEFNIFGTSSTTTTAKPTYQIIKEPVQVQNFVLSESDSVILKPNYAPAPPPAVATYTTSDYTKSNGYESSGIYVTPPPTTSTSTSTSSSYTSSHAAPVIVEETVSVETPDSSPETYASGSSDGSYTKFGYNVEEDEAVVDKVDVVPTPVSNHGEFVNDIVDEEVEDTSILNESEAHKDEPTD